MGPQKQLVSVPFRAGIDTKSDVKQLPPSKLASLQNGIVKNTGAINRRWGYSALGQNLINGGTPIAACKSIQAYNSELLLFDGAKAYSYIQADNAWATKGSLVSVVQTNRSIVRNTSQQLAPDHARVTTSTGGIDVFAWEDSRGGIRYSVLDAATGAIVLADQPLYAGALATHTKPKCIPLQSQGLVAIFFADPLLGLCVVTISAAAPAQNLGYSPVVSAIFSSNLFSYDIALSGATLYATVINTTTGGGSSAQAIIVVTLSVAPVLVSRSTFVASTFFPTSAFGTAVDPLTGDLVLLYGSTSTTASVVFVTPGGGVSGAQVAFTFSAANPPTSLAAIGSPSGVATLFCDCFGGVTGNFILTATYLVGGAPSAQSLYARSCGLASKPFLYGGAVYCNVSFSSTQQPTYFTLDPGGNVVAKANAGIGGGFLSDYILPECQQVSPGIFVYANLVKGIVSTTAGGIQSLLGVGSTQIDFADSSGFLSTSLGGELYTVGGILQRYDGAQYTEVGFHLYPEGWVATPSTTGGTILSGTYFYAIQYEWVDNTGAQELGYPYVGAAVVVTGPTGSVSIVIPTLRLTKKANVRIVVYRTTAAGTVFYRVSSVSAPLINNPSVDTLTFVDTLPDTSITGNSALYTQPLTLGVNPVLENSAPPACTLIATFANRLWIGGLDNTAQLWFSQQTIPGSPAQFSALLTYQLDPDGGPITAIARMDSELVIFKRNAVFFLTGQGPDATGANSDLGPPTQIPSNGIGCASPSSIALTAVGLFFQSPNGGIYQIDRGLNVIYVGAPVEAITSGLSISSATVLPNQWLIFTTAAGTAVVYDYLYDQWSTFTNHSAVASCVYLGNSSLYAYANPNGTIYIQTPSTFSDNGVPIPFSLTTGWLNLSALQGFQRVYHAFLLGQYKGTHTLQFAAAFDYAGSPSAYAAVPSDTALGLSTFGASSPFGAGSPFGDSAPGASTYQFRFDILRKCQAIQISISDSQSSPGNEGFSLSALALVVGIKGGGNKLPATQQFGLGGP